MDPKGAGGVQMGPVGMAEAATGLDTGWAARCASAATSHSRALARSRSVQRTLRVLARQEGGADPDE